MKLVIGLGNPGSKYAGTRHNVGFDVVAELASRFGDGKPQNRFRADYQDVFIGNTKVLLITPLTFMNLSGESVVQFVRFYQTENHDIAVICDDMNLAVGRLRWRASGSAGGQKGLSDIIQRLGHLDFPRLRIGVGRPPGNTDTTSWVLGRFRNDEKETMEHAVVRAADSVEKWISDGVEKTMMEFNRQTDNS